MHILLKVHDFEGALGKRSWTSGRGLGVAWTLFLGRLEMSEGGSGDSLGTARSAWGHQGEVLGAGLMLSEHLGSSAGQGKRKDANT